MQNAYDENVQGIGVETAQNCAENAPEEPTGPIGIDKLSWRSIGRVLLLFGCMLLVALVIVAQPMLSNRSAFMYRMNASTLSVVLDGELCGCCDAILHIEQLDETEGVRVFVQYLANGKAFSERPFNNHAAVDQPVDSPWDSIQVRLEDSVSGETIAYSEPFQRKRCYEVENLPAFVIDNTYGLASYESDIKNRFSHYEKILSTEQIGTTACENGIYCVRLGKGPKKVFISAGTHASEYANTIMLMKVTDEICRRWYAQEDEIVALLDSVTFVMMPCVNPDGFALCYRSANGTMLTNARGVNINSNFPTADWTSGTGPGNDYGGEEAGSEQETKAVMSVLGDHEFAFALDLHSRGRHILVGKEDISKRDMLVDCDPKEVSKKITPYLKQISSITGYEMLSESMFNEQEKATLTDYAFSLGIPALSIETMSIESPLPTSAEAIITEYYQIDLPRIIIAIGEAACGRVGVA